MTLKSSFSLRWNRWIRGLRCLGTRARSILDCFFLRSLEDTRVGRWIRDRNSRPDIRDVAFQYRLLPNILPQKECQCEEPWVEVCKAKIISCRCCVYLPLLSTQSAGKRGCPISVSIFIIPRKKWFWHTLLRVLLGFMNSRYHYIVYRTQNFYFIHSTCNVINT